MIALLTHWRTIATAAAIGTLALLLIFAKADARHWQKMHSGEKAAHAQTVANYRAAAKEAELADARNIIRVKAEQTKISQEISRDYQARLADARARATALRVPGATEANPRSGTDPRLPAVPDATGGPDAATRQDGLSLEERLTATETAIRLDELQRWVRAQAGVEVSGE